MRWRISSFARFDLWHAGDVGFEALVKLGAVEFRHFNLLRCFSSQVKFYSSLGPNMILNHSRTFSSCKALKFSRGATRVSSESYAIRRARLQALPIFCRVKHRLIKLIEDLRPPESIFQLGVNSRKFTLTVQSYYFPLVGRVGL